MLIVIIIDVRVTAWTAQRVRRTRWHRLPHCPECHLNEFDANVSQRLSHHITEGLAPHGRSQPAKHPQHDALPEQQCAKHGLHGRHANRVGGGSCLLRQPQKTTTCTWVCTSKEPRTGPTAPLLSRGISDWARALLHKLQGHGKRHRNHMLVRTLNLPRQRHGWPCFSQRKATRKGRKHNRDHIFPNVGKAMRTCSCLHADNTHTGDNTKDLPHTCVQKNNMTAPWRAWGKRDWPCSAMPCHANAELDLFPNTEHGAQTL